MENKMRNNSKVHSILSPKREAFGVDLSDLSVKVAEVDRHRRGGFRIRAYGRQPMPAGLLENGEIQQARQLNSTLGDALRNVKWGKLSTKNVIVSLPESKAFLRVIQLPRMSDNELAEAVPREMEQHIPIGTDKAVIDWNVLPLAPQPKSKEISVLVAATTRKLVDSYLDMFDGLGYELIAFEIESVATARSLVPRDVLPHSLLLVDIGARRTSFIIYDQQTIQFTSSNPIAGQSFTEAIAKHLGVNQEQANHVKVACGLDRSKREGKVYEALQPPLSSLVTQIKESMDFYHAHNPNNNQISKILLCGGSASLVGLDSYLTLKLGLSTALGNPWTNFRLANKHLPKIAATEALEYTTAIGLAMRGANSV